MKPCIRCVSSMGLAGWLWIGLVACASGAVVVAPPQPPAPPPPPPPTTTGPVSEVTRLADEATTQFKAGHIEASRDLLRQAVRAYNRNDADVSDKLADARSVIDPPSTRPNDDVADALSIAAWGIVKSPGKPAASYALGLDFAKRSVAITAGPYYLASLGAAQYRTGDYPAALASLARSEATDYVAQENHASNLAFSAMAQERLGRHAEARATLQKLIDLSKVPDAVLGDDQMVFNEAAAMIDPASTQPTTAPATAP